MSADPGLARRMNAASLGSWQPANMRPPAQPPKFRPGPSIIVSRWTGTTGLDAREQVVRRFVSGIPLAIEEPKRTVEVLPARGRASCCAARTRCGAAACLSRGALAG
jgi:hypothetical protein